MKKMTKKYFLDMFEVISEVIQNKIKMLSQGVAKGNLSVTTRRVITENAPFANRSVSDSELLRSFEITSSCIKYTHSTYFSTAKALFLQKYLARVLKSSIF